MFKKSPSKVQISPFVRKRLLIRALQPAEQNPSNTSKIKQVFDKKELEEDFSVLVLNASHNMAAEITRALKNEIHRCNITYATSIALAKLLLKRRKIDLIIASSILPDGSVTTLRTVLSEIDNAPDLLIVSSEANAHLAKSRYFPAEEDTEQKNSMKLARVEQMKSSPSTKIQTVPEETFKSLGADIRNDLNNPLQEIVAMVFVAQTSKKMAPQTEQALSAIDKAAKNMSEYVNELEERIRKAVGSP